MKAKQLKEELYNQIYNLMAWNPDPEIMERATQKTALYVVDLLIFERETINKILQTPENSLWNEVKQEILNDMALWKN
jgi:hypothetical protein